MGNISLQASVPSDKNSDHSASNLNSALVVANVSASYGSTAVLHKISLDINQGELVALLGANGAGKTTLMRCISGMHPTQPSLTNGRDSAASVAELILFGESVSHLTAAQRVSKGIALVPEGRKIFPRLTVRENLLIGAYLRNDRQQIRDDEAAMYEVFPVLYERRRQQGGTLSGGEQQMLAIARAVMSQPRLLLLDEPSMGVAPLLVDKIFETILRFNQGGISILLVEQNVSLALAVSSRAYVIELGRIVITGSSSQLLVDPLVQSAYLGA